MKSYLENFKKNSLGIEEMKAIKGGTAYYNFSCTCSSGGGGFQGYGTQSDIGVYNNYYCGGSASCKTTLAQA